MNMKTKPVPGLIARVGNIFTVQGAADTYQVDLTNPSNQTYHSATTGSLCNGGELNQTCAHLAFARDIQAAAFASAGVAIDFMLDLLDSPGQRTQLALEKTAALDHSLKACATSCASSPGRVPR